MLCPVVRRKHRSEPLKKQPLMINFLDWQNPTLFLKEPDLTKLGAVGKPGEGSLKTSEVFLSRDDLFFSCIRWNFSLASAALAEPVN